MSSEGTVRIEKVSAVLPVSRELLFPEWVTVGLLGSLGIGPDTRTDEEKARDRAAWEAETRVIRERVQLEHAQLLAGADGLRRAVLEMHGPSFYSDTDRYPRCEGCDMEGYEVEAPGFPCRTYTLAADFAGGGTTE